MKPSVLSPSLKRIRSLLFFALGATLYILGVYTSFFGQVTLIVPLILGIYTALFVGILVYERIGWTGIVIDEGLTILDEKLMALLDKQREVERMSKKLLESMIDEMEYTPIKLLLLNIMLDTEKHEKLVRNIVRYLSGELKVPSREEYYRQVKAAKEAFETHVKIESDMIKLVNNEVRVARSRLLRIILNTVLEEERAHHRTFQMILGKTTWPS